MGSMGLFHSQWRKRKNTVNLGVFALFLMLTLFANGGEVQPRAPLAPISPIEDQETDLSRFAPSRNHEQESRPLFGKSPEKNAPTAANPTASTKPQPENQTPQTPARPAPKSAAMAPETIIILLVGVAGICIFAILLLKRYVPGGKALFSTPSLEILGRTQVDRQKYLALVRAGRRVLVVGVTPDGFNALSEITDATEVTEILMDAKPQNKSGKNVFLDLFKKHATNSEGETALANLQEQVKNLRGTGN